MPRETDSLIEPENKLHHPRPNRYEVWPTVVGYALVDNEVVGALSFDDPMPPGPWVLARSPDLAMLNGLADGLNKAQVYGNDEYWYGPIESGELQKALLAKLKKYEGEPVTDEIRAAAMADAQTALDEFTRETGIRTTYYMLLGIEDSLPDCLKTKTATTPRTEPCPAKQKTLIKP